MFTSSTLAKPTHRRHPLWQSEATIDEVIQPGYYWVKHRGTATRWRAIMDTAAALQPGDTVYVVGRIGNRLVVQPTLPSAFAPWFERAA